MPPERLDLAIEEARADLEAELVRSIEQAQFRLGKEGRDHPIGQRLVSSLYRLQTMLNTLRTNYPCRSKSLLS